MNIHNYLEINKKIQNILLGFLENEEDIEDSYQNLNIFFDKIGNNKHELTSFLHLISCISQNHHRTPNFYLKIERILRNIKNCILNQLSNSQIFNIFKKNKRILLFLFDENIISMNESIAKIFQSEKYVKANYPSYFSPEIKPYIHESNITQYYTYNHNESSENDYDNESFKEEEMDEIFSELRKIGENDSFICKLIRDDSIQEFITYVNKNNCSLKSTIESSIYETNSFLLKNDKMTLIEYAAFFGSIQIFQYLQMNNAELSPRLWDCAIHGKNTEIIHFLEEKKIEIKSKLLNKVEKNPYISCVEESIKCHHNDFAEYFLDNYFQSDECDSKRILFNGIQRYNFLFIKEELINEKSLVHLCQYGYYLIVKILLTDKDTFIDQINMKTEIKISVLFFFLNEILIKILILKRHYIQLLIVKILTLLNFY